MTELAPGLYVDEVVPAGSVFRLQADLFFGYAGTAVAIHPSDWERIPGAERERLLDELVRADAKRGQQLIEAALAQPTDREED